MKYADIPKYQCKSFPGFTHLYVPCDCIIPSELIALGKERTPIYDELAYEFIAGDCADWYPEGVSR